MRAVPDDKVVLAVLPSPEAARLLADDFGAAFEARLAYLREHTREPMESLTPVLEAFAAQHGFAWDAEDGFSWDELDPLDPAFHLAAIGPLFLASHPAAYSIAEVGLQRLARVRGATSVLFMSHDVYPLTLTLHFTSELGVRWFNESWESIFFVWGADLELADGEPPDTGAIVHFTGPGLSTFVVATSSDVLTTALLAVAQRPDVEAGLRRR